MGFIHAAYGIIILSNMLDCETNNSQALEH